LSPDEFVLVAARAEGAEAAGAATDADVEVAGGERVEVENGEGEIESAVHEAGGLGEDVAGAFEFEADDEVGGFLDLDHENAGAEGVGRAAGDDEGVAGRDGDFVEAGFDGGEILRGDVVAELGGRGRALEADVDVADGFAGGGRRIADGEDVVGFGFAAGGGEDALGEFAGGVDLEVEARAAVQEFDEDLGLRAVASDVGFAEEVGGVAGEEGGEVVGRGVVADEDLRDAAAGRGVGLGGIFGDGGGGDPVFGEMGVGGGG
jgi:hypothetical protein